MQGIIIILGSPNDAKGNLSSIAIERLTQGIKEYSARPGFAILLTGGFGVHFNTSDMPHAYYAMHHLMKCGVSKEEILEFVESASTMEDAILSRPILEKYNVKNIVVVTSDFHAKRAKMVFERELPGFHIVMSPSVTHLSREQMALLEEHEDTMTEELDDGSTRKKY